MWCLDGQVGAYLGESMRTQSPSQCLIAILQLLPPSVKVHICTLGIEANFLLVRFLTWKVFPNIHSLMFGRSLHILTMAGGISA